MNVFFWYLQRFMVESSSLALPEQESAECQTGTLGENILWAKNKMAAQKVNNYYNFAITKHRD